MFAKKLWNGSVSKSIYGGFTLFKKFKKFSSFSKNIFLQNKSTIGATICFRLSHFISLFVLLSRNFFERYAGDACVNLRRVIA